MRNARRRRRLGSVSAVVLKPQAAVAAWVVFDGTAGPPATITGAYNVSSLTDTGAGDTTVNWEVPFPDAHYAVGTGGRLYNGGTLMAMASFHTTTQMAAGSCRFSTGGGLNTVGNDLPDCYVVAVGNGDNHRWPRRVSDRRVSDVEGGRVGFWIKWDFNGAGSPIINASYNITSVTDDAVGKQYLNFEPMPSTMDYLLTGCGQVYGTGSTFGNINNDGVSATSTQVHLISGDYFDGFQDTPIVTHIGFV